MKSKRTRFLLAILIIIVSLPVYSYLSLIAVFSGSSELLLVAFATTYLLLIIWLIIWALKLLKTSILRYTFFAIIGCFIIFTSAYKAYESYIDNIPTMHNDAEIALYTYQPFEKDSEIARLKEASTLHFENDLPRIDGATALYPLYAAFVEATYPKANYDVERSCVQGGKTPKAYERLINGDVDIIFCAAPSKEQIADAASKGKTFDMTPIGREAFVFFVNKKNPVRNITITELQDIYSGKITNWKDVGGKYQSIRPFQRPKGSGSQTALIRMMKDIPLMEPLKDNVATGMGGIIEKTADYKNFSNAIGYSFRLYASEMVNNNQIEFLKVNGVYPNRESIENDTYPFTSDFYAITTDTQNKNVKRLIEWILSPQGKYLIEKTGYIPHSTPTIE